MKVSRTLALGIRAGRAVLARRLGWFAGLLKRSSLSPAAERPDADPAMWHAEMLSLSEDAVFVWHGQRGIESWNQGAEALYGFQAEEARGRLPMELLRTHSSQPWEEVAAALEQRGRWEGELVQRTKDDTTLVVSARLKRFLGTDGLERILETNRDVTERKRVEDALRRSEENFAKLFRGNAAALCVTRSSDGVFLDVNDRYVEVTGLAREDVIGKSSRQLNIWKNPEQRREFVQELERHGVVRNLELPFVRKNGEEWTALVSSHVSEVDGERVVISSFVDITDRQRAQTSVQQSETLLRLSRAQEIAQVGSWEHDLLSNRLIWSDETYRIYGLRPDEAPASYLDFLELVHPEDRALVDSAYMSSLREGRDRYEVEHRVIRRSTGETRFVREKCQHVRDSSNRIVKSMGMVQDITERRATDLRLAYLASFPEKSPYPIVEADVQGRVRYANPAALRQFPDLREQGIAHPWLAGWPALARTIREGQAAANVRVVTIGDRTFHQELIYAPEEGVIRSYGLEITEARKAEKALRESEAQFRKLFDAMSEGVCLQELICDEQGNPYDARLKLANPAFERHTGIKVADFIGRTQREVFPGLEPLWLDYYRKVAFEGEPARFQAQYGSLGRWFEVSAYQTQPGSFAAVFFDITDRKRAQEQVLRSREGLSRLAEASRKIMSQTELNAMLHAICEQALVLTGAGHAVCAHGPPGDQVLVSASASVPGAQVNQQLDAFPERGSVHMDLLEGAETIRLSNAELAAPAERWHLPEGHILIRGLLGARMVARNGLTDGVILVTDKDQGDFTDEDEVLLRQLATVASLALQHVEARMSLEDSDRRKNQFLAMLSHELRNPLAPIRNSLFILDRTNPGGEQARRAHSIIDRQIGHMTRLVDDLLDVTRISRGKIQLQRERMDICDVVRRAVEDYREAFAKSRVELQVNIPVVALWTNADRTRIAQVVGNLLNNAAKFTQAGGKTSVSLEPNLALRQATLRVRDTGVGIAPDMLPRVFEAFAQADTTLDRSKGGIGLGLSLVKGLVEMHGGSVSVHSEGLGKGSEFMVRLPLELAEAGPIAAMDSTRVSGSRRVLIIEDNIDAADSLREVLELSDHKVEVAFSGPDGIQKARAFGPDLVVCDIGLPGMSGYDVAKAFRSDDRLHDIALVALTGYAGPEDQRRAARAGFDHHLAKPPDVGVLERILGETPDRHAA